MQLNNNKMILVFLSFLGDRILLSDIDIIDGTPVLDIKPYISEYDSPHTRVDKDLQPFDSITDLSNAAPKEEPNIQHQRTDDVGSLKSNTDVPVTDLSIVSSQFSLSKDIYNVLEDIKAYVSEGDSCQSEDCISKGTKTKPPDLKEDRMCYGEEAYSTIAHWIREPPVGSLDVRFTPHAERQLADFLPSGKGWWSA